MRKGISEESGRTGGKDQLVSCNKLQTERLRHVSVSQSNYQFPF